MPNFSHPGWRAAVGGGIGAGLGGAFGYYRASPKERKERPYEHILAGALGGGLTGAYMGATFYGPGQSQYRRSAFGDVPSMLNQLGVNKGAIKSKADLKKAFRTAALKHHPDRGGNPEVMKQVNKAYEELQNTDWFNKLAFELGLQSSLSFILERI